jgi:hypothetical protein
VSSQFDIFHVERGQAAVFEAQIALYPNVRDLIAARGVDQM